MAATNPPRPLVESDDRNLFDCGRDSINGWFRRYAWINQLNGMTRVSVLTDATAGRIIGYVTLNTSQIERTFLPKSQQRNRPDPVPTLLLGQLAVDKLYQGQGYAADLMLYALNAALHVADIAGCAGVIAHPLDDSVRSFYQAWGFQGVIVESVPNRTLRVPWRGLESLDGLLNG